MTGNLCINCHDAPADPDIASALQGLKHAVPKQILQLMNVEGMTRENVASHLQKYRLHLKPSAQGSSLPPEQPPPPKAQQFDQQVGLSDTGFS